MAIAAEFGGKVLVGRLIALGGTEDEAATEGKCLRSGASLDEFLEFLAIVVGKYDG
jgi:hypothetical protein